MTAAPRNYQDAYDDTISINDADSIAKRTSQLRYVPAKAGAVHLRLWNVLDHLPLHIRAIIQTNTLIPTPHGIT